MKASELRIGNLVKLFLGIGDKGAEYLELQINGIMIQNNQEHYLFKNTWVEISNNLEPIPLTEEWLLKFEFEKQENNWKRLAICNDWTYIYWERLAGVELSINKHSCMLPHIQYVHQLQNLYFALTNEELSLTTTT